VVQGTGPYYGLWSKVCLDTFGARQATAASVGTRRVESGLSETWF
jgi:hypothetical protein